MNAQKPSAAISSLCLVALVITLTNRGAPVAAAAVLLCLGAATGILWRHLPELSNLEEDSPKLKTLRGVTVFTVVYFVAAVGLAIAADHGWMDGLRSRMTERQQLFVTKFAAALVLAIPMAFYGNVAPKLPLTRHTGLRLPWTVRDEETWVIAHRLLGYLSIPLVILLFTGVPSPDISAEAYVKFWWTGGLLAWILIPSAISGLFFWKKYGGKG